MQSTMREAPSLRSSLKGKSRAQIATALLALPEEQVRALMYDWHGVWARDSQLPPPGDWLVWLIKAGRGFGKTRIGAEETREAARRFPILHLVARTAADIRDTMVEGPSGVLAVSPPNARPKYEPSKRRLTWENGCKALLFSADEPDSLRGPQCYWAWADEIAAWSYPDAWDQLLFGLRLGARPRVVVTTTPRPTPLIRALVKDPNTVVTHGSTFENSANLAPTFLSQLVAKYEGTRLGRQELHAELLDDTPGALWSWKMLEPIYVRQVPDSVTLRRTVVAVDPAVTSNADSDETGLLVVGLGSDNLLYVLADESGVYSPLQWAEATARLYHKYNADRVIAEVNNGGDLVEVNLRQVDRTISYRSVRAAKGKHARAEPVAALYEQARVRHLPGLQQLETQMTTWSAGTGEKSPDRIDALVWGITELALTEDKNTWAAF